MTHQFYNEDCIETLVRMADKSVRLLFQDPPFGVTQNVWDVAPDLANMWPLWERVAMDNAAFLFFATQPFATDLIMSNRKMFRYDLIWYKPLGTGFLNANRMPLRNHEYVLVFYKALPVYNPQMAKGPRRKKGLKGSSLSENYGNFVPAEKINDTYHPHSVFEFSNGDNASENEHPTQKPLDLIRYLIRTYSNPGDMVFDGYLGSGTALIAAYEEGRQFIGAEMNKAYYEGITKRFDLLKLQPKLFR